MTIEFFNAANTLTEVLLINDPAQTYSVDNYTQANLENDYFIPSNGLTIVIETE